jgi:hypothetical protein
MLMGQKMKIITACLMFNLAFVKDEITGDVEDFVAEVDEDDADSDADSDDEVGNTVKDAEDYNPGKFNHPVECFLAIYNLTQEQSGNFKEPKLVTRSFAILKYIGRGLVLIEGHKLAIRKGISWRL